MNARRLFSIWIIPVLLIGGEVSAQFGLRCGPGLSDIVFRKYGQTPYLSYEISDLEHRLPLWTFEATAFYTIPLGRRFEFQPELQYAPKGLDYSTEFLYDDITYAIRIHYLQSPLLFRYKLIIRPKRESGFVAGPYGALKLRAVKITRIDGDFEKTAMDQVRTADVGITAGYSMDIALPRGQLVIDFRGSYGLMNMMKPIDGFIPWYYGPDKPFARNIGFTFSLGYRFWKFGIENEAVP